MPGLLRSKVTADPQISGLLARGQLVRDKYVRLLLPTLSCKDPQLEPQSDTG